MNKALNWMVPAIFILALAAALAGLWPAEGQPYPLTSFRGEEVMINARGLYYWDTVSSAAQMKGNDMITLFVGLPLLTAAFFLSRRGSLRGKFLLSGTLGFFLYTYMSMCVGAAYNPFFLVYVALFGLSLYAFIVSMLAFDLKSLPERFSPKTPRVAIAVVLFSAGAFLSLAWLGRIAPTLLGNQQPALDNTTTMFIQAMDLVLVVPLCFLAGILLLRRSAWGYLLGTVGVMKFITMGLAVSTMAVNMALSGVAVSAAELTLFPALVLANLTVAYLLLRSIRDDQPEGSV